MDFVMNVQRFCAWAIVIYQKKKKKKKKKNSRVKFIWSRQMANGGCAGRTAPQVPRHFIAIA